MPRDACRGRMGMSRNSFGSRVCGRSGRIRAMILAQGALLLAMAGCGQLEELSPVPVNGVAPAMPTTYTNPLSITIPSGGKVESCADPWVMRGQAGDDSWYAYCTADPLNK